MQDWTFDFLRGQIVGAGETKTPFGGFGNSRSQTGKDVGVHLVGIR